MPFINISVDRIKHILDEPKGLLALLQAGTINPKEYEVLELFISYHSAFKTKKNVNVSKNKLVNICKDYMGEESEKNIERLIKFAETRQNVSWVLFVRSCQFLKWENKNPVEGYQPRLNYIKKHSVKEIWTFPAN